jgi:hypothetical protein
MYGNRNIVNPSTAVASSDFVSSVLFINRDADGMKHWTPKGVYGGKRDSKGNQ